MRHAKPQTVERFDLMFLRTRVINVTTANDKR